MSRFAFVAAERASHAVATLCRVIGASVSGFYAWLRAIPTTRARAEAEAELRGHIGRIFAAQRRVYGSPRVHAELGREGRRHSRRRVERLMRETGRKAHPLKLHARAGRERRFCRFSELHRPCPGRCEYGYAVCCVQAWRAIDIGRDSAVRAGVLHAMNRDANAGDDFACNTSSGDGTFCRTGLDGRVPRQPCR